MQKPMIIAVYYPNDITKPAYYQCFSCNAKGSKAWAQKHLLAGDCGPDTPPDGDGMDMPTTPDDDDDDLDDSGGVSKVKQGD